jgi:hypothetical protein
LQRGGQCVELNDSLCWDSGWCPKVKLQERLSSWRQPQSKVRFCFILFFGFGVFLLLFVFGFFFFFFAVLGMESRALQS